MDTCPPVAISFTIHKATALNINQKEHWSKRTAKTKDLRTMAAYAKLDQARGLHLLPRVHCLALIGFPDGSRRDPANWYPTFKACIDGMIKGPTGLDDDWRWRILDDDDSTHLDGPDPRGVLDPGLRKEHYRLTFTFTPIPTGGQS